MQSTTVAVFLTSNADWRNGERRAISFYPDVRIRYVEEDELRPLDPQLHSFINVNTAEEWQSVLAIIEINKNIE